MAGHGSPPAEDKANHPNRRVGRLGSANLTAYERERYGTSDDQRGLSFSTPAQKKDKK